jgi:hypothetical protein
MEHIMYISNITYFLDETGEVPKQMPKEARELASFMALVIDTTTKSLSPKLTPSEIRCFEKGCHGLVIIMSIPKSDSFSYICLK